MRKKQITKCMGKGITRFGKSCYRGRLCLYGKDHVAYFSTKKEAAAWVKELKAHRKSILEPGVTRTIKQAFCIHPDLPIGLHENLDKKPLKNGGIGYYPTIIATIRRNDGTSVCRTATYGNLRTRDEAIALVEHKRETYVAEHKEEFIRD